MLLLHFTLPFLFPTTLCLQHDQCVVFATQARISAQCGTYGSSFVVNSHKGCDDAALLSLLQSRAPAMHVSCHVRCHQLWLLAAVWWPPCFTSSCTLCGAMRSAPLYINHLGMAPCKWGTCLVLKYLCAVWREEGTTGRQKSFATKSFVRRRRVLCLAAAWIGGLALVLALVSVGLLATSSWQFGTVALSE